MSNNRVFADWLRKAAAKSEHLFVRDSEAMVCYLIQQDKQMPDQYGWRVTSVDALARQAKKTADVKKLNRIYWHDMARSMEAYGVMVLWRSTELIESALESLNLRQILAPAILSRSLLELATVVIINYNNIYKTVKNLCAIPSENSAITSRELEELLVKAIYGTRVGKPPEYLKQTNVLTFVQRLSRNPKATELLGVYNYLCDLAHPNVLGNARFWASVETKNSDGSETLRMERNAESVTTTEIREKILWSLGWSAISLRNGFDMGQDAVRMILRRWP